MDDTKHCTIILRDEVNCKIDGVDAATRKKMQTSLAFFLQYARHTAAFKLGRWDGMKRFCDIGGRTYTNLLDTLVPIIDEAGYTFDILDQRKEYVFDLTPVETDTYADKVWPVGHVHAGKPIMLRDHQVESINIFLQNTRSMGEISTGSGKTMITASLSHAVEKYGRTFVIVPNIDLVTQTARDYVLLGLDVGVYYGDKKELGHKHTICTWQSLDALEKKEDNAYTLEELIEGVIAVITDEVHSAKSDSLFHHLTKTFKDCPIRWGLTGTIPLEDADKVSLLAAIGPVVTEVTAKELQDLGVLSNLHINIMQIQDYHNIFTSYAYELQFLVTDIRRLRYIADSIREIIPTGNTLILVDRIATGKVLNDLLADSVFVSGSMKNTARKVEYDSVQNAENKPIIATYKVASTGIDIPRIFNVVMIEAGKSFIKVIQTIGRGIRVAEDKNFVNIYDICSSAKYSKSHLAKRKKFYDSKEYKYTVNKLNGDYL